MMQIYRIKHPPEYKSAVMDWFDLSKQLGDDKSESLLRKMHAMLMHNESLTPIWVSGVSHVFKSISPVSEKIPDISSWGGPMLLLSARAYGLLKERIEPEGEFLPIAVDGEPMQIFNCLAPAKEKEELCVRRYFQGNLMPGLEKLYFNERDVADRFLFISRLEGGSTLYCSSHLKVLVEELGLQGLRFDEDLLDVF